MHTALEGLQFTDLNFIGFVMLNLIYLLLPVF